MLQFFLLITLVRLGGGGEKSHNEGAKKKEIIGMALVAWTLKKKYFFFAASPTCSGSGSALTGFVRVACRSRHPAPHRYSTSRSQDLQHLKSDMAMLIWRIL